MASSLPVNSAPLRILVVAAHPDDEVLGMGGTIAKLAANGAEIKLLIVTDGSSSQYRGNPDLPAIIEAKKEETARCAAILGIREILHGGLPDMRLDITPHVQINQIIESAVESFRPSVVFTHFSGDINADHQRVSHSTLVACRPTASQCVKRLYFYSVPSSTEWNAPAATNAFLPNVFFDISGPCADLKYRAFACYGTELRPYPHPRSVQYLQNADAAVGNRVGLPSAEAFMLVRSVNP
ncbi:MAG: PIG-L family deacetylase [Kiritimatiellae bacterium]|nr:PIG-L family deacetylase [Kiritimatiellia bacterium]